MTERQINLLRRGLKFTPTPKPNTAQLKCDIKEFSRKLYSLIFPLWKLENSQETREIVKNKSNFYTPRNRDKFLDTTINFIQKIDNLNKYETMIWARKIGKH